MIFPELMNPAVSMYIHNAENGLVCQKEGTPDEVLRVIERINSEYSKIHGHDCIKIL